MKRILGILGLSTVVVFATFWIGLARAQDDQTDSVSPTDERCAYPDILFESGVYDLALEEYMALVATPGMECAWRGVAAAAVGQTPTPTPVPPTPTPTPTPVPPTPAASPSPIAIAKALKDAGYDDGVKDQVVAAIKADPEVTVPPELHGDSGTTALVESLGGFFTKSAATTGALITLLAAIIVAGYVLCRVLKLIWHWLRRAKWPRKDTFVLPGGEPPISVDFEPIPYPDASSKFGLQLTELIQVAYQSTQQAKPDSGQKLMRETPASNAPGVDLEITGLPVTKLSGVLKLLDFSRPATHIVNGTIIHDATKGTGLILTVEEGSEIRDSITIWYKDFMGKEASTTENSATPPTEPPSDQTPTEPVQQALSRAGRALRTLVMDDSETPENGGAQDAPGNDEETGQAKQEGVPADHASEYMALAETAGIWLIHAIAKIKTNKVKTDYGAGESGGTQIGSNYHVEWNNWQSYALFRNAQQYISRRDYSNAITLLRKSLGNDPMFLPALMNLYTLEMEHLESGEISDGQRDKRLYEHYRALFGQLWCCWGSQPVPCNNEVQSDDEVSEKWQKAPESVEGRKQWATNNLVRAKLIFNYLAACNYALGWSDPQTGAYPGVFPANLVRMIEVTKSPHATPELRRMRPSLEVLRAILKLRFPCTTVVEDQPQTRVLTYEEVREILNSNYDTTTYNLACLYVAGAFHPNQTNEDKEFWIERAVDNLEYSVKLGGDRFVARARTDHDLWPLRKYAIENEGSIRDRLVELKVIKDPTEDEDD